MSPVIYAYVCVSCRSLSVTQAASLPLLGWTENQEDKTHHESYNVYKYNVPDFDKVWLAEFSFKLTSSSTIVFPWQPWNQPLQGGGATLLSVYKLIRVHSQIRDFNNVIIFYIHYINNTVFVRCLNTFWKTWLIASKLNTQANRTLHWEIYIDIYDELKLCYRNLEILTLSGQQQYTNLLDIKHCSLSCSLFLVSSTEGRFSQPKKSNTQ